MKAQFRVFINNKKDNQAKFLLISKFAHNNTKNTSIKYIVFKLNYRYYLCISYKNDSDSCLRSKVANKLAKKTQKSYTYIQKKS